MKIGNLIIHGYILNQTCFACPQQFDVFDNEGTQVGYIRVRHGMIKVHCPDYGGDIVYYSSIKGDGVLIEQEELDQLYKCVAEIQRWQLRKMRECVIGDYDD